MRFKTALSYQNPPMVLIYSGYILSSSFVSSSFFSSDYLSIKVTLISHWWIPSLHLWVPYMSYHLSFSLKPYSWPYCISFITLYVCLDKLDFINYQPNLYIMILPWVNCTIFCILQISLIISFSFYFISSLCKEGKIVNILPLAL